jgi:hypothetical protein
LRRIVRAAVVLCLALPLLAGATAGHDTGQPAAASHGTADALADRIIEPELPVGTAAMPTWSAPLSLGVVPAGPTHRRGTGSSAPAGMEQDPPSLDPPPATSCRRADAHVPAALRSGALSSFATSLPPPLHA